MDINVRKIGGYKEVLISIDGMTYTLSLLDVRECKELAIELMNAATELIGD